MSESNKFLQIAVFQGYQNLGITFPNPSVGAVIVRDGLVISRGVTGEGGSPHAEIVAINNCDQDLNGAVLYVTLEPCVHVGKNPACVDVIIKSGIKKVVIGVLDINPLVAGDGVAKLKNAGIEVEIFDDVNCKKLHEYFFYFIKNNKPFITSKIACSIDGKIALGNGESKWITNEFSRNLVHLLRSRHDAVLTSIGTVEADNPTLDCRIKGYERNRVVIVHDPLLKLNINSNLVRNIEKQPLIVIHIDGAKNYELESKGVKFFSYVQENWNEILENIALKFSITSIFVEAGGFNTKLLKEGVIDELLVFRANKIFGGDAMSMIKDLDLVEVKEVFNFGLEDVKEIYGGDILEIYR